jgi:hypothetical protein
MLLLFAAAGCHPSASPGSDKPDNSSDDTGAAGDTASCVEEPGPPADKILPGAGHAAALLTGTITWTLDFDAVAEAAGFTDCTYTRVYTDNLEVADQGYLCPTCSLLTTGTSEMTSGYDDCYAQISTAGAERVEHLGLGDVDGVTHLFRSGTENVALGDVGVFGEGDPHAVGWTDSSDLDEGGTMVLTAVGELTLGTQDATEVEDIGGARTEPYACGWPTNSPGGSNESWTVADGEIFPNLRLEDQCGEPVDLWDFRGYYLVIDSSSENCGPCQAMADSAEAFKATMEDACVPVEIVTLLNESLSTIYTPASLSEREDWVAEFGLTSPVLGDRGAGAALMPDYLGIDDGMSYPAVILVDPDGRVFYGDTGFSDWTKFQDAILANEATRAGTD